ncbi:MAG: DUF2793 domain-containing protein [Novosphingobium sp.]|nr:DUF2793 domain-containing protein [Novosphingobium sp.]
MPDPFDFEGTSPRFDLPFLFAGQAQKEAWVNEAHARIDALLHCSVEGERSDPPVAPADGEAWIVATGAIGEWAGRESMVATWQADNWLFVAGREGMRVFDRSTRQERLFTTAWQVPLAPPEPSGGSVVDLEARAALSQLISALRVSGVFPES